MCMYVFTCIFQSFTGIFQSCYMLNTSSRLVTNVEASGVRRLCPGLIYGRQPLHSNIKIFQIGQFCIKIYQRNAATRGGDGGTYETSAWTHFLFEVAAEIWTPDSSTEKEKIRLLNKSLPLQFKWAYCTLSVLKSKQITCTLSLCSSYQQEFPYKKGDYTQM